MRCLALSFMLLAASCAPDPRGPEPVNLCEGQSGCVSASTRDLVAVDGDTFELRRLTVDGAERIRLRLIGWDSPETGDSASCAAEQTLGEQVEARARALFSAGQTITFKPEGVDRFGRMQAHVYLDGIHIGWLLAEDGLSRPWSPGEPRPDWCAES
ncbi:MAG: thermonuclease family protein [Henriciella sp.]|nr:thermonuclease family protein [Henriciella sp.]